MLSDDDIIKKLKITQKDKVLDIGGSMMQHGKIKVDTLVDIINPKDAPYSPSKLKAKKFVQLDITRDKLPFKKNQFDVVLCTHTLEDLYNPFLVIEEMQRVGKRGLIITPSMGADMVFSPLDITNWLTGPRRTPGLSHHKWFFVKKGKSMQIIPKNYGILYSEAFQITGWNGDQEFIHLWKGKIDYEVFPELNIHKLIDFYDDFVTTNRKNIKYARVLKYHDNLINTFKAHLKYLLRKGAGFKYRHQS
jgi:hypothetical protein